MDPETAVRIDALLPAEMVARAEQVGVKNAEMDLSRMGVLGVLAGAFIALGAVALATAGAKVPLGHWLFGYIHPYPDGNGRMARFLMNVMLASGGYPWTVIRKEHRDPYLAALDRAGVDSDIRPFAAFIAERVRRSLKAARTEISGAGGKLQL